MLPFAFRPGTEEFNDLVDGCVVKELRQKFRQLETLSLRGLRTEVGPTARLFDGVFRSPSFALRCRGGFDLGVFLQRRGKLLLERGDEIDEDAMRVIFGAIILLVIEHARRRPTPFPPIRVYLDEATNAMLMGTREIRALAETRKLNLHWTIIVQNLDFPTGTTDSVLNNCRRHEVFGLSSYELARKMAADLMAGLPPSDRSRAERIDELTYDIMGLRPGERWVREGGTSWKDYVELMPEPWPDWGKGDLRQKKLAAKISKILARPEYGVPSTPSDTSSCGSSPPPPSKSPDGSSLAERLRRRKRKPADGSASSDAADGSR